MGWTTVCGDCGRHGPEAETSPEAKQVAFDAGWSIGGKTWVTWSTTSTSVETMTMKRIPATMARTDFIATESHESKRVGAGYKRRGRV